MTFSGLPGKCDGAICHRWWCILPPVFPVEPGKRLNGGPRVILQTIIKVGVDKITSCDHIQNRIVDAVQLFTQKGQPVAENGR